MIKYDGIWQLGRHDGRSWSFGDYFLGSYSGGFSSFGYLAVEAGPKDLKMRFADRTEAGKQLGKALLKKYKDKNTIVYGLPRGGVVVAAEVAKKLRVPLDLIITRKIGHQYQKEYAIAATSENGRYVGNEKELQAVDKDWFALELKKEQQEAKRRRLIYLKGRKKPRVLGKTAIIVDDGIATGLTMRAAIKEIRHHNPKRVIVVAPVAAPDTVVQLKKEADDVIVLDTPSDFYAIGQYYDEFEQVNDEQVIQILTPHHNAPTVRSWVRG